MSTFSSTSVPNDCLLSSSQRSFSADSSIFYDAFEENVADDARIIDLEPPVSHEPLTDIQRPLPKIIESGIENGIQSVKDLNSIPMRLQPTNTERPVTSAIQKPLVKMPSETTPVLPILLKSGFYKDARKFSFQKSLSYTNKIRHLVETYQNGNIPSALTSLNEPDDSREEELNLRNDSDVLAMRFRSSLSGERSSSSSRYYVIDRETGKSYPLPNESNLLPGNAAFGRSVLKRLHHQESQSGKKLSLVPSSLVSVDKRTSDEVILNSPCPSVCNSDTKRDSSICKKIDDGATRIDTSKEKKTPPLIEQKRIMPDNIEDKSPCKIPVPESTDATQAEENYQTINESSGDSRQKDMLQESTIAPGYVRCEAGENFVMALIWKKRAHEGPIWTMKFSLCGKYLATAGKSGVLILWEVLPKKVQDNSMKTSSKDAIVTPNGSDLRQVLSNDPLQKFEEHKGHNIVDLSWSKSNFLLSASLDKTVRLWHVSKSYSLRVFHHADYVTSVDFNPLDDQYFLSGGFDKKIRVWSIVARRVKEWAPTPDIVTAAKYSLDGKLIIVGMMKGQVYFYSAVNGLRYFTQIACRNRHGSKKDGRKVTGLQFRRVSNEEFSADRRVKGKSSKILIFKDNAGQETGENLDHRPRMLLSPLRFLRSKPHVGRFTDQLLVTTNDGRMRLYGLDDFCLLSKFKGSKIPNMQINASFSQSGQNIVCGSEDGRAYIWDSATVHDFKLKLKKFVSPKKYNRIEYCARFSASKATAQVPAVVTETVFVPECVAKEVISGSEMSSLLTSHQDWSCAMIVASDYEGNIKIFAQKKCLAFVS